MKKMRGFICLLLAAWVCSCANIGTPNGGPYDEQPPTFISSAPPPHQVNYKGKSVEIVFDELIVLDKPSENVIITPPQMQLPVIRALGKKVVVELKDTLQANATYTIDFTRSITDNNEKNVLENFSFAFATGDVIDSLEVSGYLLNAENLEPVSGITIGLHKNLADSAFTTEPFLRTSRTDDRGKFVVRNMAAGTYRIFGLNDVNRDYRFDQPGEEIAFGDSLIVPAFELAVRQDTVWKDSLTVDTVKEVHYTRFLPDNIRLLLFKEKFARQYLLRPERSQGNRFTLRFNAPLDSLVAPVPLNFRPADSVWYVAQWAEGGKAVHYWLTDSLVWQQDTLMIAVHYPASDSLNVLRPQTDTLSLTVRSRPEEPKKRKKGEPEPVVFLGMKVDAAGTMDIFDTVRITFDEPVREIKKEVFRLKMKADTQWVAVEFDFIPDATHTLGFAILRQWNYGEEYRLAVDSAAIRSLYGKWNNGISQSFSIKREDQYGHLFINIEGLDTVPAFVELLDNNDRPVRKAQVANGGVLFMNLLPNKYYARLIMDANGNFVWDTGNYAEKRQPETVYYCPKVFDVKQNWEAEETWNLSAVPFIRQKPLEITKNKPKEMTKAKRDYKSEGRQNASRSSGTGGRNFSF